MANRGSIHRVAKKRGQNLTVQFAGSFTFQRLDYLSKFTFTFDAPTCPGYPRRRRLAKRLAFRRKNFWHRNFSFD
jgi:hypothetical protein